MVFSEFIRTSLRVIGTARISGQVQTAETMGSKPRISLADVKLSSRPEEGPQTVKFFLTYSFKSYFWCSVMMLLNITICPAGEQFFLTACVLTFSKRKLKYKSLQNSYQVITFFINSGALLFEYRSQF